MAKNKVVIFGANGAKVFITDNAESFSCELNERLLINPDLSYVNDVPPELWNLEGDKIVPLFGDEEIKQRLANLGVKSFSNKVDDHIKQGMSNLVDIPGKLCEYNEALKLSHEMLNKKVFDSQNNLELFIDDKIYSLKLNLWDKLHSQQAMLSSSVKNINDKIEKNMSVLFWLICVWFLVILIEIGYLIAR